MTESKANFANTSSFFRPAKQSLHLFIRRKPPLSHIFEAAIDRLQMRRINLFAFLVFKILRERQHRAGNLVLFLWSENADSFDGLIQKLGHVGFACLVCDL